MDDQDRLLRQYVGAFYDQQGEPLTLEEWARDFEDVEARRVAQTKVGYGPGKKWISTVFLGVDHNWTGKGPPLIFETMGFHVGGGHQLLGFLCQRYHTRAQAEQGHRAIVDRYRYTRRTRRHLERGIYE